MVDTPLFRDTSEFSATIDAAAEQLGISALAVEKDYWVSEVLRTLAHDFPSDFIFKGGTSLSKGYHLIQRFSDDIDLLILPRGRGRNAVDRLMKTMSEHATAMTGGVASPTGASETGRHRAFDVSYPATRPATAVVRTSVLLEMGVRGGDYPHDTVEITSLLGDALSMTTVNLDDFADLSAFETVVLHPARTLLEKLMAIDAEVRRLVADVDRTPDRRIDRHFYDIYELLGGERVQAVLADKAQVARIIDEIDEVNRIYFGSVETEGRQEGGYATSPAFARDSDVAERLSASYASTMAELYFGSEPFPTWDAICDRVSAHHTDL